MKCNRQGVASQLSTQPSLRLEHPPTLQRRQNPNAPARPPHLLSSLLLLLLLVPLLELLLPLSLSLLLSLLEELSSEEDEPAAAAAAAAAACCAAISLGRFLSTSRIFSVRPALRELEVTPTISAAGFLKSSQSEMQVIGEKCANPYPASSKPQPRELIVGQPRTHRPGQWR